MAPEKRTAAPPRSRPTPKAKPKAKARQKVDTLTEETTSIVEVADGDSVFLQAPSPKLARVDRLACEHQVERVILTRLVNQFSVDSINGVVNSKGEHVRAYIARHILENMGRDQISHLENLDGFLQGVRLAGSRSRGPSRAHGGGGG